MLEVRLAEDHVIYQDFRDFLVKTAKHLETTWRRQLESVSKYYAKRNHLPDSMPQEHLDQITKGSLDEMDTEELLKRIKNLIELYFSRLQHLPVLPPI